MRRPTHRTIGTDAPPIRRTLGGTLLLAGLLVVVLLAVSAPAVLAGIFLTTAVAVAVVRTVRRGRHSRPRQICVPRTEICVEA